MTMTHERAVELLDRPGYTAHTARALAIVAREQMRPGAEQHLDVTLCFQLIARLADGLARCYEEASSAGFAAHQASVDAYDAAHRD